MNSSQPVSTFFIDKNFQNQFEMDGFAKINIASEDTIASLQKVYDKYFFHTTFNGFTYSNQLNDYETNLKIQENIKGILLPVLNKYLKDFRVVLALFYIKPPGRNTSFYLHRDWSIVDESKYSSVNIWLPLSDTDKGNGNLVAYPGSHMERTWRGSPELSYPKMNYFQKLKCKILKQEIFTQKGEAVFFDHRLLHSSNSNLSPSNRIVAAMSVVPSDAKLIHYKRREDGSVERLEVEDDFYLHLENIDDISKTKSLGFEPILS